MILSFPKSHDEQLSKNFWLREFHCPCTSLECNTTLVSEEMVKGLQEVRDELGALKINSAYRCAAHNKKIGGKENSFHLLGIAADVVFLGGSSEQLEKQAKRTNVFIKGGIGRYRWGCHLDVRGTPARWIDLK